jgi:hypothetical protein
VSAANAGKAHASQCKRSAGRCCEGVNQATARAPAGDTAPLPVGRLSPAFPELARACRAAPRPSVSLPYPAQRRPRHVAVALLLILHAVVVGLLLTLQQVAGKAPADSIVTLMLTVLPKKTAPVVAARTEPVVDRRKAEAPARPARPTEPVAVTAPPRDEPQAITLPDAGAAGAANGANAAPAGASSPHLNLAIPKEFYTHPPPLTPAQEAKMDPRSNRLVLTKREQIDIDFGLYECVAWVREPDGTIYRGPGHLQRVQGVSTNPFTYHEAGKEDRNMECVK